MLACLIVVFKFRRRIRRLSLLGVSSECDDTANVEKLLQKYGSLTPRRFRYSDLKKMTGSFKHKLREGGYGTVFRGVLPGDVAVKFLRNDSKLPDGEEFLNEVVSIGRTSHANIVALLGFCLERSKRALVYEYMANGSLDRYIYSSAASPGAAAPALGWETLHGIAVGVARGLEYLHDGCSSRIIHFDVKPHNVLLDQGFRPKIADFGMLEVS